MLKKKITIFYIAALIFTLDRLSKYFILKLSNSVEEFNIPVTSFLNFNLVWNNGIAFGLFSFNEQFYYNIITLIIIIITLVILLFAIKSNGVEKIGFSMIFGGSLGNIFDRLYYTAVVDFIDIHINSYMTDDEIHHVSLSWKYNERMLFPKLISRVGDNYQASSLPPVGTGSDSKDDRDAYCYDQVFDPAKASEAGVLDCVQNATNIPASLKEAAMVALHQRGYKPDGLDEKECLLVAKPLDGSDLTDEEKALFREAIFEHRKDLKAVAKKMNKSMGNVITYYLGSYKHSDDYRLLKLVCQQEKEKAEDEVPDNDICRLCREGGHLLVCDSCDLAYHTECLKPAIETVPEGEWNCDYCLDEKLMAARDAILAQSNLLRKEQEEEVNDSNFRKRLYTGTIPDPEILIRTGGTKRLSNFLLWQLAYTEIFFINKLWPDFNENDFNKIILKYNKIKRNFGKI